MIIGAKKGLPVQFVIPGKPIPFIANWRGKNWSARKTYGDYCKAVRLIALADGGISDKLRPSEAIPIYIHTRAFFSSKRHGDPENIHKAIVDALCYATGGLRDKYTGGAFVVPLYDSENPRVEVVVADGRLPMRETIPEDW